LPDQMCVWKGSAGIQHPRVALFSWRSSQGVGSQVPGGVGEPTVSGSIDVDLHDGAGNDGTGNDAAPNVAGQIGNPERDDFEYRRGSALAQATTRWQVRRGRAGDGPVDDGGQLPVGKPIPRSVTGRQMGVLSGPVHRRAGRRPSEPDSRQQGAEVAPRVDSRRRAIKLDLT
jgi:hypothetical protein